MTDIPVKGDVLKWAREYRGLNEQDAADLLGIPVNELRAYENDRAPTLTMFEAFAAKYNFPQATLFRATRPKTPPKPTDFRTLKGRKVQISFEFNAALGNVRTLLGTLSRLAEDDPEFDAPYLPRISLEDDAETLGERERRRIGPPFQEQLGWKPNEAFRRWRARIETEGVSVFQQKFPLDDCRGFSLYEDDYHPTIVINRDEDSERAKTFTLIHEYAHLLLRRPGISDHDPRNAVEAFCNRFAAAFLIPAVALRQLLPRWPNQPVDWEAKDIARWAGRLKVSQMALAIRLEQLKLAPAGFADQFEFSGPKKAKKKATGGDYVAGRLSDIGSNFVGKVIGALDRDVIDEVQAAESLGLSDVHFQRARDFLARKDELAG